jgi:hypothetical protein
MFHFEKQLIQTCYDTEDSGKDPFPSVRIPWVNYPLYFNCLDQPNFIYLTVLHLFWFLNMTNFARGIFTYFFLALYVGMG